MNSSSPQIAGINGLGRFGLHLLQYWSENYSAANFDIQYLNDEAIKFEQLETIIKKDNYLRLDKRARFHKPYISIKVTDTKTREILFTSSKIESLGWKDKVDLFLECSGRHSNDLNWHKAQLSSKSVIVSSTSWDADKILVYGYNQTDLDNRKVLSYGSCTVNAYIPLADVVNKHFQVVDSDVNVIHNVPERKLKSQKGITKSDCTLESVAPFLLDFLNKDNFKVNYSFVPHSGVSAIDFRFRLGSRATKEAVFKILRDEIKHGSLRNLYQIVKSDKGSDTYKFTPYSAILLEQASTVVGNNLYISAYFDNENSANRFFDLTNYVAERHE